MKHLDQRSHLQFIVKYVSTYIQKPRQMLIYEQIIEITVQIIVVRLVLLYLKKIA